MRNWRFYITWIVIAVSQSAAGKSSDTLIAEKVDNAWKIVWERFCHSSTMLFYDYISSYEKGKELSHLPTTKEIKEQYPNPCGYGTGMEDCMILSGTMLETIVDRYETTGETQMNEYASNLFKGIVSCSLIESCPGFVARGICVEDDKSFYINSSRDQYTHAVYGLWKYYNSPLCSSGQQDTIRLILTNIAERLIKNVTSENNYDLLRADNRPCPLGICRMWNVQSHEAARLPMFYAAAWAVTGMGLILLVSAFSDTGFMQDIILMLSYPVSWVVGFLSPSPNGMGIREAILRILLGGSQAHELVLLIVVTSRIWTILGEIAAFAGFKLYYLLTRRKREYA